MIKFTETFKYAITSVPLAVAILNPTLYQFGQSRIKKLAAIRFKAGLRWTGGNPFNTSKCY